MGLDPIKRTLSNQEHGLSTWNLDPLIELSHMQRGILIEGGPCMGKTSLSKFLMMTLTKDFSRKNILPFWVSLHDYSNDTKESLFSYALSIAARNANILEDEKTAFIKAINHNRAKSLLFLDGLDEVIKNRVKVIDEITSLPTEVRFVITTRKSEYGQDLCVEKRYSLEPLDPEEVEAYANHIFESFNSPLETRIALRDKLNNSRDLYELTRSPFSLEIMCLKVISENVVPSRKADIYQFLTKWILNHYSKKEIEDPAVLEYLGAKQMNGLNVYEIVYSKLAFEWFKRGIYNFARSDVVKVIEEISKESGLTNHNLQLTQIILNSGVLDLYASTNGQYAFSHLSVMEYFTAFHILYREDWREFIRHNSGKESWRNAILILIGLLGEENYEEVYNLLTRNGDFFHNGMILAVEGANELGQMPRKMKNIVNDVLKVLKHHPFRENLIIDVAHTGSPIAKSVMIQLLKGSDKGLKLEAISLAMRFKDEEINGEILSVIRNSIDKEILEKAVYEIGYLGYEKAIDYFVRIVGNKRNDDSIRSAALNALGNIGSASGMKEAVKILKSKIESCELKRSVVAYLNPARSEEEIGMLLKIIESDGYRSVKWEAAHTLARCKSDKAIAALETLLSSPELRDVSVYALGEIGTEKANKILLGLLKKEGDIDLRRECARAAGKMELVEAEESLLKIASGDEPVELRKVAVQALGNRSSKDSLDKVVNLLHSEDEDMDVRLSCVEALRKMDPKRGLESCIHFLKSKGQADLRKACARALGDIGSDKGVTILTEIFNSPQESGELREICTKALGEIGSDKAIDALKKATTSRTNDRRFKLLSLGSLWQIGGRGGQYAMEKALGDKSDWTFAEREEIIDKYSNKCDERTLNLMIEGYRRITKMDKGDKLLKRLLELIYYYSKKHDRVVLSEELGLTSEV